MSPMRPLYARLLDAGIPKEDFDHHESDLYVRATNQAKQVIQEYCTEMNISVYGTFKSNIEPRDLWFDCPFCYLPFWEEHCGKKTMSSADDIETAYRSLYAYQEEAAEDDYIEYLEENFSPDSINWKDDVAVLKSCLRNLTNEVYDDIGDEDAYNEVLEQCGITDELLA